MATKRTSADLAIRRKMRKGTHSCFECRRRKIRCIYAPENPNVCTECFARGSRCIDQEHASPESIVDHRKNLRERVSRLESLVDQLLDDRSDRGAAETLSTLKEKPYPLTPLSSDAAASVPNAGDKAPLLSLFNNDVLLRAENNSSGEESPDQSDQTIKTHSFGVGTTTGGTELEFLCNDDGTLNQFFTSSTAKKKHEQTRRVILAALPALEQVIEILTRNGSWWLTFRSKCPGTTAKFKGLIEFARHAYTSGSPAHLGLLALTVGISIEGDELESYLALIDRLIISDDEYASTLEGMECLLLQAKCYADIGQPRKSWLMYRKGLAFAQLLGLHRNHSTSPDKDSIFWVLYSGDRFMSLLLGLPYGIPDAHCDLVLKGPMADYRKSQFPFLVNISMLASKVIDRCQAGPNQSLSSALDIDTQLDEIAGKVPTGWWDITPLIQEIHREEAAVEVRERILGQIAFHQTRIYLHLPFMLQSATNPRYEYSRTTCLKSSRELLTLYQFLRSGTGEPLYECKSVDFVGFTASILILLGLLGYGRLGPGHDPKQEEMDWRMIEMCMDIFQRASSERGGNVAAQSYKVLEQLSQVRHLDARNDNKEYTSKVVIPYFGTISIRRGQRFNSQSTSSISTKNTPHSVSSGASPSSMMNPNSQCSASPSQFPTPPHSTNAHSTPSDASNVNRSPQQTLAADPFIAYDGFYMPHSYEQMPQTLGGEDTLMNLASTAQWGMGLPMGLGPSQMDIDQDWTMFLTDQTVAPTIPDIQPQHNPNTQKGNSNFFVAFN